MINELDHTAVTRENSGGWISSELALGLHQPGRSNASAPEGDPADWLTGYASADTCMWLIKAPPKALVFIQTMYLDLDLKADVAAENQDRLEMYIEGSTPIQTWVGRQQGLPNEYQLGSTGNLHSCCWTCAFHTNLIQHTVIQTTQNSCLYSCWCVVASECMCSIPMQLLLLRLWGLKHTEFNPLTSQDFRGWLTESDI
jgi:hypothetical protein